MNDFTKEELIDMHYAIRFFWKNRCSYDLPSDEEDFTSSYDLMEKIQHMLDNYCEHEPHGDFHVCVDKCKKCGVIVNDY